VSKNILLAFALLFSFSSFALALFDTGTSLDQGKFEVDAAVNPFPSITYGQNFVFLHYGLGNKYEVHGYFSKWGTIYNWQDSTYEGYIGILKQWAEFERLDLATVLGIRKVMSADASPSLIGPGFLYTIKINKIFRLAGHLQYIGDISNSGNQWSVKNYNRGYTSEVGLYLFLTPSFELAGGAFTNSEGTTRPIYTLNFYF
jgi:hypothetical protein